MQSKHKIVLIGASGAIGKEIVKAAMNEEQIDEIYLIVRRVLPEWKQENFKCKLNIQVLPNFDDLTHLVDVLKNCSTFICTLGSRVNRGEKEFVKVDSEYVLNFANLANQSGAKHFYLLTSQGSDSKSMFLYLRTKGKIEQKVTDLKLNNLVIFRPGLLKNRDNDKRFVEQVLSFFRFPGVESQELGVYMLYHAIQNQQQTSSNNLVILEHSVILDGINKMKKEKSNQQQQSQSQK